MSKRPYTKREKPSRGAVFETGKKFLKDPTIVFPFLQNKKHFIGFKSVLKEWRYARWMKIRRLIQMFGGVPDEKTTKGVERRLKGFGADTQKIGRSKNVEGGENIVGKMFERDPEMFEQLKKEYLKNPEMFKYSNQVLYGDRHIHPAAAIRRLGGKRRVNKILKIIQQKNSIQRR